RSAGRRPVGAAPCTSTRRQRDATRATGRPARARVGPLRMSWMPKPRPAWVEELNAFGRQVGPAALVALDEASLIAAAREQTGLDEFGEAEWREGFGVLVQSLEAEADLNLV